CPPFFHGRIPSRQPSLLASEAEGKTFRLDNLRCPLNAPQSIRVPFAFPLCVSLLQPCLGDYVNHCLQCLQNEASALMMPRHCGHRLPPDIGLPMKLTM